MSVPEGLLAHQSAALVDGVPEGIGKAGVVCSHEGVSGHPTRGSAGVVARQRVDDDGIHGLAVEQRAMASVSWISPPLPAC